MDWIHHFQLFLFDFDGLLVNTEHLHFEAYIAMCRGRGFDLPWDFHRFCLAAHYEATGLKEAIYKEFPKLYEQEPRWEVLYAEKKQHYMRLLKEGKMELLPGVEKLLIALQNAEIRRCVATNSSREQIEEIQTHLPLLQTIPIWVTREQYTHPKPASDAYVKAVEIAGNAQDRIIGFEDSMRGLRALEGISGCKPVLICASLHPQMREIKQRGTLHFETFEEITADRLI